MNVDPDKEDSDANTLAENRPPKDIVEGNEIGVQDHVETEKNDNLDNPVLISSTVNSGASNEKETLLVSTESTGSNSNEIAKEAEDWEVVDASSDESEGSIFTEYDIKIPLKLLEKAQDKPTVNIPPSVPTEEAALSEGQANSNEDDCIVIGSNSENTSTQQSTESTKSKPSITEKQNINTKPAKPIVTKKRKFRLFTGESDDEIIPQEIGHKKHLEKQISPRENVQIVQNEQNHATATNTETNMKQILNNQSKSSKLNETYTKSYSDTEVTDSNLPLRKNTREPLPNVTEESDDEIEVPRSPQCVTKSVKHVVHSKNKLVNLDTTSPHKHCCQCTTAPLVGTSNSKQAKRLKLMQHMLQERERKLKMKMVKRVKDVFFQVLETLMSSSDESDVLSASDDETGFDKMLKRKRPNKSRHEPYQKQSNDSENIRDLEKEIQYWKSKAQSKPKVLSPQELQMKEMREKLNYWKKIAMTKSRANDLQCPPSSMGNITNITSPVIEYDEPSNRRPTSGPNGTKGTSTVDTAELSSHFPMPDLNQSEHRPCTDEYPNEVEVTSSHNKPNQINPFRDETFKTSSSSHASHALSVMSRTKFTEKEKDVMIDYLVKHYDSLELIKGNMFWMQMAHDLNTHRSWHSLKNNFFQSIMKNLEQYEIPLKVRNKIISIARQYM